MVERVSRDAFKGWVAVVVEDDPASRDIVSTILERYGATVHSASNGQAGLETIRTVRPQFVISDLDMPIMNGWQMAENLREDPELAAIPVVALSAHFLYSDKIRAETIGFTHYIAKPITPSRFIRELVDILLTPDSAT